MLSKLGDIAEVVMGQSPPGDAVNHEQDGLPLLNGPSEFGSRHPLPVQYTTDTRKRAQANDLLFCVRGSTTGRMNWADQEYAIGRGIAAIRHKTEILCQPFIRAAIELKLSELLASATGSTFPNVSKDQLISLPIPSIGLGDQLQISLILGTLDDRIELNRQMAATLKEMARAIFKSWFIDFDPVYAKSEGRPTNLPQEIDSLFPDSFEESELGKIPTGWQATEFVAVSSVFDSKRVPLSSRARAERKGVYPYYGATSVMDYVDDYLFDGVYLLMGEDGSVINPDGTPYLQYVWGKFWVNNHAHVIQGANGISTEHLLIHLMHADIGPFITGAVQLKLNQGNMNRIPFLHPGLEIAELYTRNSQLLFGRIRELEDQTTTLRAMRDSLLPQLLSGNFKVQTL